MKVLTIKEPYATLIAYGIKKYEFRTWKTKYRGEFLLHAGKGIDKKNMHLLHKYSLKPNNGYIIAKVVLSDCIEVTEEFRKVLQKENKIVYKNAVDEQKKIYAFKLENVKLISPIKVDGKLSFWNYEI